MCVVSMIGDHYADKWRPKPWFPDPIGWPIDEPYRPNKTVVPTINVSREEFDALRKEVEEMKELLKRAKKYDEDNGEPDCEIDEKMELLRRVAEAVGVDLSDVVGRPAN